MISKIKVYSVELVHFFFFRDFQNKLVTFWYRFLFFLFTGILCDRWTLRLIKNDYYLMRAELFRVDQRLILIIQLFFRHWLIVVFKNSLQFLRVSLIFSNLWDYLKIKNTCLGIIRDHLELLLLSGMYLLKKLRFTWNLMVKLKDSFDRTSRIIEREVWSFSHQDEADWCALFWQNRKY